MKKTAIVSCYFIHNYGSILQAYATQRILDNYQIPNETINVSGFLRQFRKDQYAYILKSGPTSALFKDRLGRAKNLLVKKFVKNQYTRNLRIRDMEFTKFADTYIRKSEVYRSLEELSERCEERYDHVLIGSDQLWLPANIAAKYYTLNFVPEQINTIAYATSFGVSSLPADLADCARSFLTRIKRIGVREHTGQKIVKELTGRDVPIVCDPTLLLTAEEWLEIQKPEPIIQEPYIFCYFLGEAAEHREFAKNLRKKTGIKIVALPHINQFVPNDKGYADETPFDIDPADFLNLIRHASYVCTDSFHCTAFSMLYEKEFYVFRRYAEENEMSTNGRLETLLMLAGLGSRMLQGTEDINLEQHLDYTQVFEMLEQEKKKSLEYLLTAWNLS